VYLGANKIKQQSSELDFAFCFFYGVIKVTNEETVEGKLRGTSLVTWKSKRMGKVAPDERPVALYLTDSKAVSKVAASSPPAATELIVKVLEGASYADVRLAPVVTVKLSPPSAVDKVTVTVVILGTEASVRREVTGLIFEGLTPPKLRVRIVVV